jgi:hypothetical protein
MSDNIINIAITQPPEIEPLLGFGLSNEAIMSELERVARAIMIARGGQCLVKDWDAERRDNPNVAEAWAMAAAAMRETRLIDAEAMRFRCGMWEGPKTGKRCADWLQSRAGGDNE